tara:strand:+ start:2743 stop:3468 length:726 start_codon:yes stop_codon:yes gene_type:complete
MKFVFIIGAKSDLAKAIAEKYASEGYNLYLGAKNNTELKLFSNDMMIRYENKIKTLEFDASNFVSHKKIYNKLKPKPEIVIYVIGYLANQYTAQNQFEVVKKTVDANYLGSISILNIVANDFEKRGYGSIIGISSVAGDRGRRSNYIYGSAKAGYSSYLSGLRSRLFHSGIHVLTVKPGFMDTKMTTNLNLPKLITASTDEVAAQIFTAEKKKKNIIYTKGIWKYVMFIIRLIPEFLFKRI